MLIVSLFIIFFVNPLTNAQTFEYVSTIGDFKGASSFYINPTGNIYFSDQETNEIGVMDTLGNIIEIIGGYGWTSSAFDQPADIFADALKVFVADKNNHRIQQFDKFLNFSFPIFTRNNENEEERFGYPLSAVMSNQGDIFILDSENLRIIKFDIFGNFIQNFAGHNYGSYSLENPKQLSVSMQNNIFVIDGTRILIFDQYGNTLGTIESKNEFTGIKILFNWMSVNTEDRIFTANLRMPEFKLNEVVLEGYEKSFTVVSSLIFNNKLYILTRNNILIFNRID
jgi:hypothetical protein